MFRLLLAGFGVSREFHLGVGLGLGVAGAFDGELVCVDGFLIAVLRQILNRQFEIRRDIAGVETDGDLKLGDSLVRIADPAQSIGEAAPRFHRRRIGFDATVTLRSRRVPLLRGFFVYLVSVIQTIILDYEAAHVKVHTDNESWEDDILMLVMCNGPREGGGFRVAPDAVVDDGILEYTAITKVSRPMMFRLIPEVMKGTHGRFKQVRMNRFTQLKVESDRPLFIHIDGEIYAGFGSDVRRLSIEVIPDALEVMV